MAAMSGVDTAAPSAYQRALRHLGERRYTWCVTGVAGFIGSHLLHALLDAGQEVRGLDNFATGFRHNLEQVEKAVGARTWRAFHFREGDVCDPSDCAAVCEGADFVLHQAALGSVPRSIEDPRSTHEANVDGFLNMLTAARDAKAARFVYASSSAVYGDHEELPKVEDRIGSPLSPYAASKRCDEIYAEAFARSYGMASIGLRYFNVFGARQDPEGAYAAVIPRWISALVRGAAIQIYGDGETSRDFCYIDNVVQANLLAALTSEPAALGQVYNVAVGERTTLSELFALCRELLEARLGRACATQPEYTEFRPGDVRHSHADISKAQRLLGYAPTHGIRAGLAIALDWYIERAGAGCSRAVV